MKITTSLDTSIQQRSDMLSSRSNRALATYAARRDPLRGVFRAVGNPLSAAMNHKTNLGYPTSGSYRQNLVTAVRLLNTVAFPGPSTLRVGTDSSAWPRITNSILTGVEPGRGGLLDLGDAYTGAEQTFLTRQVTLTDFCYPDVDIPGALIMTLRHPLDINSLALESTPPGRDPRAVELAWYDLSETAAVAINRMETCGVRPSLVSLSFLAACRYTEYPDRSAAEALHTHIISNFGCRRICDRLERFSSCLTAMVRCRVFPHQILKPLGGLLSWVSQREICSITAVTRGMQEGVKTEQTQNPRSSFNVPLCTYIDLDKEIKLPIGDKSLSVLYIVFIYSQRLGREGFRVHIVRSTLAETSFKEGLEHLYARLRTSNAITGIDISKTPKPSKNAHFPLMSLYRDIKYNNARATGWSKRNAGGIWSTLVSVDDVETNNEENSRDSNASYGIDFIRAGRYKWEPDLRNRPTSRSCMYAAYCRLGYMDESSTPQTRSERCGSVNIPIVFMKGLSWNIGEWRECF